MDRIKGTVLISDRNKGLLTALVLLLQKVFSRVATEAEPARIVEMAATGDIDIVVLDTGQNGGSGQKEHIRLVEEIVALKQNVQVVVLTNFGQSAYAMELAEAGAFDFVPKPWNNEKLLVTLRNAFQMRQLSNALRQAGMMDGDMESDEERSGMSSGREKVNEKILTLEQMEKKMISKEFPITWESKSFGITTQSLASSSQTHAFQVC